MSVVRVSACGGALSPVLPDGSPLVTASSMRSDPGWTSARAGEDQRPDARQGAPLTDVLFDFCGVLVDWQPARALEGRFPTRVVEDFVSYGDRCGFMYYDDLVDGGTPLADVLARYEAERGTSLARVLRTYYEHVDQAFVGLMPGMLDLVGELKAAGLGVWGLTNWGYETFPAFEGRFPLLMAQLDGVFVSGREGLRKPQAACYRAALERFGLTGARTLFFDDNPLNVDAARAAGLQAERFRDAGHCRRELASRGIDLDAMGVNVPAGRSGAARCAGLASDPGHAERRSRSRRSDGASSGAASRAQLDEAQCFLLTAAPGRDVREGWRAVRLGDLVFPGVADPYAGLHDAEFWPSRHREYNELGWHEMDWDAVRHELTRVAVACEDGGPSGASPLIELNAPSMRERMFLEMWFGYGDPAVMASERGDGRFDVTYGAHRICALADFPMGEVDRRIMRLGPDGFTAQGPLDPDTLLPVLVRGRSGDAIDAGLDDDPNDGLRPAA